MGNCCSTRSLRQTDLYEPLLDDTERDAVTSLLQFLENRRGDAHDWADVLSAFTTLSYSSNIELQRSAALAFSDVVKADGKPVTREMLAPILRLLGSHDSDIQRAASIALGNLAVNDHNKRLIVEMGGLEPLLRLLSSPNLDVQSNACGCFTNLATLDANKTKIVSSGALPSLVQLCHSDDLRVVRNAAGALLNLTHADKNRPALVRAGCLAVFVRLLRASNDTEIQYYCAAALSNIAVDGEHRRLLLAHVDDLLPGLIAGLDAPTQQVQVQSALALLNLASDEDYQSLIVQRGGVAPLVRLIKSSMAEQTVLVAAVAVLRNLSIHPLNASAIVESGCAELLLTIIRTYAASTGTNTVADIMSHCVSTLRNIAGAEAHVREIMRLNGVETIVELLSPPTRQPLLLSEVAAVIAVLAVNEAVRDRLATTNATAELIHLTSADNHEVQGHAAAALGNLVASDAVCLQFVALWDAAEQYVRRFLRSTNPTFAHIATWTTYELCRVRETRERIRAATELMDALGAVTAHEDAEIAKLATKTMELLKQGAAA